MASTSLARTPSGAGNRKTFTWSGWVKRSILSSSASLFSAYTDDPNRLRIAFNGSDKLIVFGKASSSTNINLTTTQVFRDPSAWYPLAVTCDTTQSTEANRIKVYFNGEQVTSFTTATYPSQYYDTLINSTTPHYIGQRGDSTEYLDGYMSHTHFTDGYAYAASTFGSTSTNGQWVPTATPSVTYGTNGFFLKFTNASDLGEDFSGNNNDYTKSGSGDKTNDNPENVFATWNNVIPMNTTMTMSSGNLEGKTGSNYADRASNSWFSTIGASTGKWYAEFKLTQNSASDGGLVGVAYDLDKQQEGTSGSANNFCQSQDEGWGYQMNGNWYNNGANSGFSTYTTNDIIGVALDLDNNKIYWSKNGTWQNSANPSTGSNGISIDANQEYYFAISDTSLSNTFTYQANFGNPIFSITSGNADGNGKGTFEYAPPTNFLALCSDNLSSALTQPIGKGGSYMNTVLYTGNGSNGHAITGVGFQPDWVWLKSRSNAEGHWLGDSNRGANLRIQANTTGAEFDTTSNGYPGVSAFDSDGFTVGRSDAANGSGNSMVAWNWRAGGSNASNSDGSITSSVTVNTTAGFSVVTYTGNETQGATVGHGLGKIPKMIITKCRSQTDGWGVYNAVVGSGKYLLLNTTAVPSTATTVFPTTPTSSLFYLGDSGLVNGNSRTYVSYCFAEIEGYSKFGSYTGNGSTDGPFIYTGLKPAWVMIKRTDGTNGWNIYDSVRNPSNVVEKQLFANSSAAEEADASHNAARDFLSNGFKIRETGNDVNASGASYIYMVFAENPFVDSAGVPTTAR